MKKFIFEIKVTRRLCYLSLILVWLLATSTGLLGQADGLIVSTPEEIKAELEHVPCDNRLRQQAVKDLFVKMGAAAADVKIVRLHKQENVVVELAGANEEKILIGAHYDKVSDGCGAIDNWTGIVTLAHLYRSIKSLAHKKTIIFVAFANEEKGLLGSHEMTKELSAAQSQQYCAMLNIDSLGLAIPQTLDNISSAKLEKLTGELAEKMKIPYAHASIAGANGDSSSFLARKIPAITIHGLSSDWHNIIHTGNDKVTKINGSSVYLGYRLVLALIKQIDDEGCGAFR
jgi:Iap family predicted aminopeptidase